MPFLEVVRRNVGIQCVSSATWNVARGRRWLIGAGNCKKLKGTLMVRWTAFKILSLASNLIKFKPWWKLDLSFYYKIFIFSSGVVRLRALFGSQALSISNHLSFSKYFHPLIILPCWDLGHWPPHEDAFKKLNKKNAMCRCQFNRLNRKKFIRSEMKIIFSR